MTTCIKDLNDLKDIFDELEPQSVEKATDKDIDDFKESLSYFIEDYIDHHIEKYKEKDFETTMFEDLCDIIKDGYLHIDIEEYFENYDQYQHTIWDAMQIYFHKTNTFRSYSNTTILKNPDVNIIKNKLKSYENLEQPEQQSKEWFIFRREGLSASDLYKALDTDSKQNQLILSKCLPIDFNKKFSTNINSACHNGHKYEPLSIMHYEKDFDTKVGEFGCIRHKTHKFLRASPDGINIDPNSPRYGRLVEVKNPTSRQLDGIPKKEYWVQMQLQMEVWDLDECDFLETVFKEYESEEEFRKDGESFTRTNENLRKGIIVQFFHNDKPHYEYPPVDIDEKEFDDWYDEIMEKNKDMTYIMNLYWYLKDYSCVLVTRNKKWFNCVYPKLKNLWDTVLKERETGYEHRRPKRKNKVKKTSKDPLQENIVIKIRTESFDDINKN